MAYRHGPRLHGIWLAWVAMFTLIASHAAAREVVIRIVGDGGSADYIEEGATSQEPVEVRVGDTVVWRNEGNRTHTATAENDDGDLLFDTGDIQGRSGSNFESSDPIEMTAAIFASAGGQSGQSVSIVYFCEHHSAMESSLSLSEARDGEAERPRTRRPGRKQDRKARDDQRPGRPRAGRARAMDGAGVLTRRDITSLSATELRDYRDAWRRIQENGDYASVAGYHGCPDRLCHGVSDQIAFLAWHREYILRLEAVLGQPVHYWDWTLVTSASSGIPVAFTDATYVSSDGRTYPNPLQGFRYVCPSGTSPQTTFRRPSAPSQLANYAREVRRAYGSRTYRALNSTLENPPHDAVHGWVSGHMGAVYTASYDPLFWAHHANVDRQWASWQRGGGPDPTAAERALPLRGFSGRTIDDVKSIAALGYEYDRYDATRGGVSPPAVPAEAAEAQAGVGKTFAVPRAEQAIALDGPQPTDLYVSGIPAHPQRSYFVYVFVNQPNATPANATEDNPNFAGTFGVFGMGGPPEGQKEMADHDADGDDAREAKSKRVLELFGGKPPANLREITQVTLVATDETGAVVSRRDVPFDGVSLRSAGDNGGEEVAPPQAAAANRPLLRRGREFTGISNDGSYDDAYSDAVRKARDGLRNSGADRIIETEVVSVKGEHDGIAGVNRLKVTIRARSNK